MTTFTERYRPRNKFQTVHLFIVTCGTAGAVTGWVIGRGVAEVFHAVWPSLA